MNTPETQQADDDLAVGRLVQAVAESPYGEDTLNDTAVQSETWSPSLAGDRGGGRIDVSRKSPCCPRVR